MTKVAGVYAPDGSQYVSLVDGAGNAVTLATGTVTTVSVVSANGITGSVATAGTTPAITLTLGAITPTTVNGVTIDNLAWTAYTPTLGTQGGSSTLGINFARYKQFGKTITVNMSIVVTAALTGTGFITATLPFTSANFPSAGSAFEFAAVGVVGVSWQAGNVSVMRAVLVGGTIVTGYTISATLSYELP